MCATEISQYGHMVNKDKGRVKLELFQYPLWQ